MTCQQYPVWSYGFSKVHRRDQSWKRTQDIAEMVKLQVFPLLLKQASEYFL